MKEGRKGGIQERRWEMEGEREGGRKIENTSWIALNILENIYFFFI